MDRWKSGTPETCHSSHHHAVCTLFLFPCRSSSLPPPPLLSPPLPNLTFFEGISFHSIHLYLLSRSRHCWETSASFPLVCHQLHQNLSFFSVRLISLRIPVPLYLAASFSVSSASNTPPFYTSCSPPPPSLSHSPFFSLSISALFCIFILRNRRNDEDEGREKKD